MLLEVIQCQTDQRIYCKIKKGNNVILSPTKLLTSTSTCIVRLRSDCLGDYIRAKHVFTICSFE